MTSQSKSFEENINLLVYGYCNQFCEKQVPIEIIELCIQFYKLHSAIILLAVGKCGNELNK